MNKEKYIEKLNKIFVSKDYTKLEIICLEMIPKYNESFLYYYLGKAQFKMNMLSSSEYNLKKSIFMNPNFFDSYNILADIYIILKEPNLAIDNLSKSIEVDPNNINIHIKYITILINQKNKDKSIKALNNAINLFPNSKELKEFKNNI